MICTYCRQELDDQSAEAYRAIAGWETIDGSTELQWIARDVYACRPSVEQHFVDARAPARGVAERLAELLRDDDAAV